MRLLPACGLGSIFRALRCNCSVRVQQEYLEVEEEAEETAAASQHSYPDLSCAAADIFSEITKHLDWADKSSWRLVSKAACQAVYESTTGLAPCNGFTPSPAAVLPQLLAKCGRLKQLSCRDLYHGRSIAGLLQPPPGIEALDISCTDLTDLGFIARCPALKRLTAARVPGCEGQHSLQLAALLEQLPGLTALELYGNKLSAEAALDVAAVLLKLTGLEELGMGATGAGRNTTSSSSATQSSAAVTLLQAVPHLTRLRRLDLTYCFLGAQALLPALSPLTRLQQLKLINNSLQADGAHVLAPAFHNLTLLEELDLSGNQSLGDEGMAALAPAIQQLTCLKALVMPGIGLSAAGAEALAPALRHLTGLQRLELQYNKLQAGGAAQLVPAIQGMTGLLHLDLAAVILGARGVTALAPALRRLTALQHLRLSFNTLRGSAGLPALLLGIRQLVSLRSLDLQCNMLDREVTLEFAMGIRPLTGLQKLDLSRNNLGAEFGQRLADIVQSSSPGCQVSYV